MDKKRLFVWANVDNQMLYQFYKNLHFGLPTSQTSLLHRSEAVDYVTRFVYRCNSTYMTNERKFSCSRIYVCNCLPAFINRLYQDTCAIRILWCTDIFNDISFSYYTYISIFDKRLEQYTVGDSVPWYLIYSLIATAYFIRSIWYAIKNLRTTYACEGGLPSYNPRRGKSSDIIWT